MFSSGIIPSGGEQFLPLFYENLETLFDYCKNSQILIHNATIELFDERTENLKKFRSEFRTIFPNFRKSQTYEMFSSDTAFGTS